MGQFGYELRRERESRGIPLDSITGVTKISERHLVALEEERFDVLPGGVLSKGMVRGYARAVGLDEDAWVGRYLSAYHESGQIKDDDAAWMEFAENVGRSRRGEDTETGPQRMRWAGVALLLTLLALFSWYVARMVSERALSDQRAAPAHAIRKQEQSNRTRLAVATFPGALHGQAAGPRPSGRGLPRARLLLPASLVAMLAPTRAVRSGAANHLL